MYARCPADGFPIESQQLTSGCLTKDFPKGKFEIHKNFCWQ